MGDRPWLAYSVWALLAVVSAAGCLSGWLSSPSGAAADPRDQTITLFGAASTGNVLEEIVARFHQGHDIRVECSFAASSTLAQQIASGARADVFVSANQAWVDYLEDQGLVIRRQDLLSNKLVVVVPRDSDLKVQACGDMLDQRVRHVALAEPVAVPAGIYARQALEQLGLWERLRPKVVAAAHVRQALAFVETGAADAAVVYATDAALSDAVTVALSIDSGLTEPIRYPVALLAEGASRPEVEAFYDYLQSPAAAEVFREHGFTVLTSQTAPTR